MNRDHVLLHSIRRRMMNDMIFAEVSRPLAELLGLAELLLLERLLAAEWSFGIFFLLLHESSLLFGQTSAFVLQKGKFRIFYRLIPWPKNRPEFFVPRPTIAVPFPSFARVPLAVVLFPTTIYPLLPPNSRRCLRDKTGLRTIYDDFDGSGDYWNRRAAEVLRAEAPAVEFHLLPVQRTDERPAVHRAWNRRKTQDNMAVGTDAASPPRVLAMRPQAPTKRPILYWSGNSASILSRPG